MTTSEPEKEISAVETKEEPKAKPLEPKDKSSHSKESKPAGKTAKKYFILGAIGMFLVAAMAIAIGNLSYFQYSYLYSGYGYYGIPLDYLYYLLAFSIVLFIGLVLSLLGFYGFHRYYGSYTGLGTFVFGLIAASIYFSAMLCYLVPYIWSYDYYYNIPDWADLLRIAGTILLGVVIILKGATFVLVRHSTGVESGSLITGAVFIIAGSFICNLVYSYLFGFFLLAAAALLGGLVLGMAHVPESKRKKSKKPKKLEEPKKKIVPKESLPNEPSPVKPLKISKKPDLSD